MKSVTDCYKLSNGVEIPCVGFGTFEAENGDIAANAVHEAIACGYRHIDTAAAYENEESVGRGIRESGVDRKDLFITSKLANELHGYQDTKRGFEETMEKLQLEYLDLYLIHWPNPVFFRDCWQEKNAESWRAMEEFYRAGRIRAIGVSNFKVHHLEPLLKTAEVAPMVNQIRLCPGECPQETVAFCEQNDILLEAYSPFGHGTVFASPDMQAIAAKYGKSIAQVCLRWSLQKGFLPLPKSVTASRIRDNLNIFDFTLSAQDMETIAAVKGCGTSSDPDKVNF